MATQIGVGTSENHDAVLAGQEAAKAALAKAKIDKPDFVLLFGTSGYDQQALLRAVRETTGRAPLMGCCAEGVLSNAFTVETKYAVNVCVIKSDELRLRHARAHGLKQDSARAGAEIAQALKPHLSPDAKAIIALPGFAFSFDDFEAALTKNLQPGGHLPLVGGGAGDNWEYKAAYQYLDDEVIVDGVVCALVSGSLNLAIALNHGCVPSGKERKVTRSRGGTIFEIDGQPALDVMNDVLGIKQEADWEKPLLLTAFGFRAPTHVGKELGDVLIRSIPQRNVAERSFTLPVAVQEGSSFWICRRNAEKVESGLGKLADNLQGQMKGQKPKLVLQFDCAARGKVILSDQQRLKLLKGLQDRIGNEVPWVGFYTFGEIGPLANANHFHHFTVVVAALY